MMRIITTACLSIALFCTMPICRAQDAGKPAAATATAAHKIDPRVQIFLRPVLAAYHRLKSYSHTEIVTSKSTIMPDDNGTVAYHLAIQKPGCFLFNTDKPLTNSSLVSYFYCDGLWQTEYRPQSQQYSKSPAPASINGIDLGEALFPDAYCSRFVAYAVRGYNLEDDGLITELRPGMPCVEGGTRYDTLVGKLNQLTQMPEVKDIPQDLRDIMGNFKFSVTYYFSHSSHLLHKVVVRTSGTILNRSADGTLTAVVTDARLDSRLPESTFAFSPPENSTAVATFHVPDPPEETPEETRKREQAAIDAFVGKPVADFAARTAQGKPISISALKGRVIVLGIGATWSTESAPLFKMLQEIQAGYAAMGVEVLCVDMLDTDENYRAFLKSHAEFTYPIILDPGGNMSAIKRTSDVKPLIAAQFGDSPAASALVIDRDGIIRTYAIGNHDLKFYEDALKQVGITAGAH